MGPGIPRRPEQDPWPAGGRRGGPRLIMRRRLGPRPRRRCSPSSRWPAGGWLLDPAGSREPGRPSQRRAADDGHRPGSCTPAVTARQMAARRAPPTYTFSGTSGGGATRPAPGSPAVPRLGDQRAAAFDADVTLTSDRRPAGSGRPAAPATLPGAPAGQGHAAQQAVAAGVARRPVQLGRELRAVAEQLRAASTPAQNARPAAGRRPGERGRALRPSRASPPTEHRAAVALRRAVRSAEDPAVRAQYRAMLAAGVRTLRVRALGRRQRAAAAGARRRPRPPGSSR